jgi:hypothetical protein
VRTREQLLDTLNKLVRLATSSNVNEAKLAVERAWVFIGKYHLPIPRGLKAFKERQQKGPHMARDSRDSDRGRSRSKFVYQGRTAEDVKERLDRGDSFYESYIKAGFDILKPKAGNTYARILPPTFKDAKHYGLDLWVHEYINDLGSFLCLKHMKNQSCAICDVAKEIRDGGDKEEAYQYAAHKKVLVWLVDRDEKDIFAQLYAMPKTLDKDILNQSTSSRTGKVLQIDHPDEGYDITIIKTGNSLNTRYSGAVERESSPICNNQDDQDNLLDFITENPLDTVLVFKDNEYLRKVIDGTAPQDAAPRDEESSSSSRRRERDDSRDSRDDDRGRDDRDRDRGRDDDREKDADRDRDSDRDRDRNDRRSSRDRDDARSERGRDADPPRERFADDEPPRRSRDDADKHEERSERSRDDDRGRDDDRRSSRDDDRRSSRDDDRGSSRDDDRRSSRDDDRRSSSSSKDDDAPWPDDPPADRRSSRDEPKRDEPRQARDEPERRSGRPARGEGSSRSSANDEGRGRSSRRSSRASEEDTGGAQAGVAR